MNLDYVSSRLFCEKRLRGEFFSKDRIMSDLTIGEFSSFGLEADRLKITLSAPVRRLQQKTQVFPLDVKASSRNRLTHSLEVQEYSRLIAQSICASLKTVDIRPILGAVQCCLANAAILHDVGNPPFGHFGEALIRKWLTKITAVPKVANELSSVERDDLLSFNGNAQGLRITATLQDLNLTLGQYASSIKVPYTVKELLLGQGKGNAGNGIHGDFYSWAYANAGVFLSEKHVLDAIRENCKRNTRHPFATIIEYADDLSYILADFEDAFDRGLFDKYAVVHLCARLKDYPELVEIAECLEPDLIENLFAQSSSEALFYLRDVVAHFYIRDIAKSVAENPKQFIESGEPDYALDAVPGMVMLSMLRDFENKHIYNHTEVQTLDLSGASYLGCLFENYERLVYEEQKDFELELKTSGGDPHLMRLASRISKRQARNYFRSLQNGNFSELYCRIRLIVDYISGMTDTFAESEFKILKGLRN